MAFGAVEPLGSTAESIESSDSESSSSKSSLICCDDDDEVDVIAPTPPSAGGHSVVDNQISSRKICPKNTSDTGPVPEAHIVHNELDEGLFVVEVCGGCARLTKHCGQKGLKAKGTDWSGCKDKPEGRVIWINLATKQGIKELKDIFKANIRILKVVFMSPPCGTASRAREIKRLKPDSAGRVIDPKPFRSDGYPDGLPDLGGEASIKVEIANALYSNMVDLVFWCVQTDVAWLIENPSNSHM